MNLLSMHLFKQSQSRRPADYAPIAKSLSRLDPFNEAKLRRKFDIAYFLCKENLAFTKMTAVCSWKKDMGLSWVQTTEATKHVPPSLTIAGPSL